MSNIKHIHEVVFLIENNMEKWTPKDLVEQIVNNWGSDVKFGSCSDNTFPKEDALEFLIDRKKVVLTDSGKIDIHPDMKLCDDHIGYKHPLEE